MGDEPLRLSFTNESDIGAAISDLGGVAVRLDGPTTDELEDWTGVVVDLEQTIDYCTEALKTVKPGVAQTLTQQAFGAAALVTFGRCFGVGVRQVRPDTTGMNEVQESEFKRLLNLRDKHVAHSANDYEQNIAFVLLAPAAGGLTIRQVLNTSFLVDPLDAEGFNNLAQLAGVMLARAHQRCEELNARLRSEAEGLDLDALYALPPLVVRIPTNESVGVQRPNSKSRARVRARDQGNV